MVTISKYDVFGWLGEVSDPEIPVLSITDLGVIREVEIDDAITVHVAPTYSGCPATEVIEQSVVDKLREHGAEEVRIERALSPPWTTDWISDEGRRKLREYGIAPPEEGGGKQALLDLSRHVACPRCESVRTALVSEFGSTPCKASYRCESCLEPFEYFKCI